jgi:hypothetical protein
MTILYWIGFLVALIGIVTIVYVSNKRLQEGFADSSQQALVSTLATERMSSRADFHDAIASLSEENKMEVNEQCLVNFYSLGCRFTGYLGPFDGGEFDMNAAIPAALQMGCRTFVFEIDYYDEKCEKDTDGGYNPRLVVANAKGIVMSKSNSNDCMIASKSNILDASNKIAEYAFSGSVQNSNDPILIVLYLLREPPPDNTQSMDAIRITYYKKIALGLAPLLRYNVSTIGSGNYYRQRQESKLLTNKIGDYERKVLFFSNAQTEVFRSADPPVDTKLDLDYIVNLRLVAEQTALGCTLTAGKQKSSETTYGRLETVEDYMSIPDDNVADIQTKTNSTWTICMSSDPSAIVPKKSVDHLQPMVMPGPEAPPPIGVHCIPIQIWSKDYDYMFEKDRFGIHSFVPKPPPLRFTTPSIQVPGATPKTQDAKQGVLAGPTPAYS